MTYSGRTADIGLDQLSHLNRAGARIELEVILNDFHARATQAVDGRWTVEPDVGRYEDAFSGPVVTRARQAVVEQSAPDLLELSADLGCRLRVVFQTDPREFGVSWIRTDVAVKAELAGQGWFRFAVSIAGPDRPDSLVIMNGGAGFVVCSGFVIRGMDGVARTGSFGAASWETYRAACLQDERRQLPAPVRLRPSSFVMFSDLRDLLQHLSGAIAWAWLAERCTPTDKGASMEFEGRPPFEVVIGDPALVKDWEAAIDLAAWVVEPGTLQRRDALGQALLAGDVNAHNLLASTSRLHRISALLLQLSQRELLSEARRTRRDAIAAARDGAYKAAEGVRSANKAAADRLFAAIAAAVGVMLAKLTATIGVELTHDLLGAALGIIILVGILGYIALYGAREVLSNSELDIGLFGDWLTEDDVKAIKASAALRSGRSDIRRARWVLAILLAVAVVALGGLWYVVSQPVPPTTTTH